MFHFTHWYPHHNREHVCVSRGWIQGRADISHYLETLWTSPSTLSSSLCIGNHQSLCTTFPCATFTQCWSSTHCKQLTNSRPPSLEPWRCLSFWSSVQLGAFYQLFNPSLPSFSISIQVAAELTSASCPLCIGRPLIQHVFNGFFSSSNGSSTLFIRFCFGIIVRKQV